MNIAVAGDAKLELVREWRSASQRELGGEHAFPEADELAQRIALARRGGGNDRARKSVTRSWARATLPRPSQSGPRAAQRLVQRRLDERRLIALAHEARLRAPDLPKVTRFCASFSCTHYAVQSREWQEQTSASGVPRLLFTFESSAASVGHGIHAARSFRSPRLAAGIGAMNLRRGQHPHRLQGRRGRGPPARRPRARRRRELLDTADAYAGGASERISAASRRSAKDAIIATKVGIRTGPASAIRARAAHILASAEASLRRLGTGRIRRLHRAPPRSGDTGQELSRPSTSWCAAATCATSASQLVAWQAAKAPASRSPRLARSSAAQMYYSLVGRDLEHEVLPFVATPRSAP